MAVNSGLCPIAQIPYMILARPLGMQLADARPFLVCAHHDDYHPKGDGRRLTGVVVVGQQMGATSAR